MCILPLATVCAGKIINEADMSSSYVEEEHNADDHELEPVKHHLEILPEAPLTGFALVKRVDETLNLTCQVVKESGPFVKFQLEWHLPQHSTNRCVKRQTTFIASTLLCY